ncbi:MAG: hypothetical protein NC240_05485 [Clostridium sp.]|nr:hypothetical protein [Clostridium sp.]
MRKKIITFLCAGFMVFSLAGCGKEDKDWEITSNKTTTTSIPTTDTEAPPSTEDIKPAADEDNWVTVGSDRTGYADVPDNYQKHESRENGQYSLQYISEADGGLVTLLDSNYGLDSSVLANEADPANIILQAYQSQYSQMNGTNIDQTEVSMDGVSFYRSIDSMPAGSIQSYEYWLYTYVAYTNDKFYTVIAEGKEDTVRGLSKKIEDTFHFNDSSAGNSGSNVSAGGSGAGSTLGESGEAAWTNYEIILDGDKYTLPCNVSALEANGWSILDTTYDEDVLEPDDYNIVIIERNDIEAWVLIGNTNGSGNISHHDGQLIGINIDYSLEDTNSSAGGVQLGMTVDEVMSILGEPTYSDSDEDYIWLTYDSPDYLQDFFSMLDITLTDGRVTEIDVRHK